MSWAKVGDELYDDPRSEAAGVDAMGLWIFALSYMARHGTDGWITLERCRRFAGRRARGLAGRLVEVGWWEAHEGGEGYRLIGWEAFLIPRAQASERSERAAVAGRKGGQAKASRARENAEPTANPPRTDNEPPTFDGTSLEVRVQFTEPKPSETLETALATRAPDPDPTRPDPDSAQVRAHASPRPSPSVIAPALPGLEGAVSPGKVAKPPSSQAAATPDEEQVFAAFLRGRKWRGVVKGATPVLDSKRLKLIRTRIAEGHSPADLAAAAQGIWLSDWHADEGQCRIDLALRDADHIERFAALHHEKIAKARRARGEPEADGPEEEVFPVDMPPLTPEQREGLAAELEYCKRFGANLPEVAAHA